MSASIGPASSAPINNPIPPEAQACKPVTHARGSLRLPDEPAGAKQITSDDSIYRLLALPIDILKLIIARLGDDPTLFSIRSTCRRLKGILPHPASDSNMRQSARNMTARCAALGYFQLLKWAQANGCPWDEWTCVYAAQGGHLDVLQWARANGAP